MSNTVYIATSLDGFIADTNNGLDWLHAVPNPNGDDMGYAQFMASIDALLMGRTTYEVVIGFDIPWPYTKPVFVLSTTLKDVPAELKGKVEIVNGSIEEVLAEINGKGFKNLYIDGGRTIQSLMEKDLIDDLILTRIPVVLGGGTPLFGELAEPQWFAHVKTDVCIEQLVQSHYHRKRI